MPINPSVIPVGLQNNTASLFTWGYDLDTPAQCIQIDIYNDSMSMETITDCVDSVAVGVYLYSGSFNCSYSFRMTVSNEVGSSQTTYYFSMNTKYCPSAPTPNDSHTFISFTYLLAISGGLILSLLLLVALLSIKLYKSELLQARNQFRPTNLEKSINNN